MVGRSSILKLSSLSPLPHRYKRTAPHMYGAGFQRQKGTSRCPFGCFNQNFLLTSNHQRETLEDHLVHICPISGCELDSRR